MRKSLLIKALLAAALPMFATEDGAAGAAPSGTEPTADQAATTQVQIDPSAVVLGTATEAQAPTAINAPQVLSVDAGQGDATASAPIVQSAPPVAQSGEAGDPVLETVKTPAHNVAAEIQEQIKKLEELPAEVAAWFESKFVELAAHIKALL